jgi:hypothetical protein
MAFAAKGLSTVATLRVKELALTHQASLIEATQENYAMVGLRAEGY